MTKFYKTTFTIDVLSEEPFGECFSLDQIAYAISRLGDCVGTNLRSTEQELTPKQMVAALYEAGSEPGVFMLDAAGETAS